MRGTPRAYELLLQSPQKPNIDTLYFIYEEDAADAKLYLGEKLIAGGGAGEILLTLKELQDVAVSSELADKQLLVYDQSERKWVNASFEEAISTFVGATSKSDGRMGLVPKPTVDERNFYLRGDGTWAPIETSSSANIWTVENDDSTVMHQDIIDEITSGDIVLAPGDIIIIKDNIYGDKWQHTSYVYTGSTWAAMDGNYNAENVYFDEDFVFTKNIGTVTIPSSGSATVKAEGKNIKDFLASLFAEEVNPTTTAPSISFTSPSKQSVEVGTKKSVQYSLSFSPGSYTYNDSTGVTATGWSVTDSVGKTATTKSGTMPEVQITDGMTYTISATATYSDGIVPVTNLGNDYDDGQIKSGTTAKATSAQITGYRKNFGGMDATGAELTSAWVRENLQAISGSEVTWKAADKPGVTRYILALPVNSGKSLKSAIITSSMNADATADYVKQTATVAVEGANGYTAVNYNVWIYEPASIASTEVHKLTIG